MFVYTRLLILALLLGCLAPAGRAQSTIESSSLDSPALQRSEQFQIYLPGGYADSDADFPVLYFFHGMFDTEGSWAERNVQEIVDQLIADGTIQPMVIAIPNGGRFGFWSNSIDGASNIEDFILQDFIPYIESHYRVRSDRNGRALSGISMGGFGSLKLAFKHPDLFSSISAHSAFLFPAPIEQLPPETLQNRRMRPFMQIFGNPIDIEHWNANDPFQLIDAERLSQLPIYFDCGKQDRFNFQQGAQRLAGQLTTAGIEHTCRITGGGESHWDQLRDNVHQSLTFHSQHFD